MNSQTIKKIRENKKNSRSRFHHHPIRSCSKYFSIFKHHNSLSSACFVPVFFFERILRFFYKIEETFIRWSGWFESFFYFNQLKKSLIKSEFYDRNGQLNCLIKSTAIKIPENTKKIIEKNSGKTHFWSTPPHSE